MSPPIWNLIKLDILSLGNFLFVLLIIYGFWRKKTNPGSQSWKWYLGLGLLGILTSFLQLFFHLKVQGFI